MASSQVPIAKLMNQLRGDQPFKRDSQLRKNRKSVEMALDKRGVRDAGLELDNLPTVTQWYFPKYQVAVIDLGGNHANE